MQTKHLPPGSFREILSRRRNASFPKFQCRELISLGIKGNPEIIDLRKESGFDEVCRFTDKLCEFIGIPPINLYWIPNRKYIEAFLTPETNTVVITGNIQDVDKLVDADLKLPWYKIISAVIGHETDHGIEGDIQDDRQKEGDIGEHFRYLSEFRADAFAYVVAGPSATMQMLEFSTRQRARYLASKGIEIIDHVHQTEETDDHPALILRQFSLMALDPLNGKSTKFRQLVAANRAGIELFDIIFGDHGVDILDSNDRDLVIDFAKGAPFHFMTTKHLKSDVWSKKLSRENRSSCTFIG
jgi:hypothetical protein